MIRAIDEIKLGHRNQHGRWVIIFKLRARGVHVLAVTVSKRSWLLLAAAGLPVDMDHLNAKAVKAKRRRGEQRCLM